MSWSFYNAAGFLKSNSGRELVSALPSSAVDGQEVFYQASGAMAASGFVWHLRYDASSASAYKWEFVGGSSFYAEVTTTHSTASNTYVALTSAGPLVTLPLGGDYLISIGFEADATSNTSHAALMSYDIGATGAVDADRAVKLSRTDYSGVSATRTRLKTGLSAVTLTAKYRTDTATVNFSNRWMQVTPIRVG